MSTLDYWFIPTLLEQCVTDCQIFTAPNTDHLAVKMVLCTKNVNRGKGVWKFTNGLLKDKIYTLRINEMINNCCEK